MKFISYFLFLLVYHCSFCQESFILKRDGTRLEFQKNSIQIIVQDKILSYRTLSGSQKDLDFNDIDNAFFGNFKFKFFKFKENRLSSCYFVLCESDSHTLICLGSPDGDVEEGAVNINVKYQMHILDKQSTIVDSHNFSNQNSAAASIGRSLISEKINTYFKNCDNLLTRFSDFERLEVPQYMGLIGFFKVPNFVNCVN